MVGQEKESLNFEMKTFFGDLESLEHREHTYQSGDLGLEFNGHAS